MTRRKDFQQFYLIIRPMRQNMVASENFKKKQEIARSVYLHEMGINDKPKNKQAERLLRGLPAT